MKIECSGVELTEFLENRHEFNFDLPAHDRVFHIFSSRIMIASKCDKSPANLNTFILCVYLDYLVFLMKYFVMMC